MRQSMKQLKDKLITEKEEISKINMRIIQKNT